MLGEPSNDVDTDMLAAMEDLLDSWPGTLLVVSHDRYLVERVTDQQFAIIDGHLRHLPGGVDEYLRLRAGQAASGSSGAGVSTSSTSGEGVSTSSTSDAAAELSGAELRALQKELASVERRITRLTDEIHAAQTALAEHDHTDYVGLAAKMAAIGVQQDQVAELEERWLELSELVE